MIVRIDAVGLDLVGAVGLAHIAGVLLDEPALVLAVLELDAFAGGGKVRADVPGRRAGLAGPGLGHVGDEPGLAPGDSAVGGLDDCRGDHCPVGVVVAELAAAEALVFGVDEESEDLACFRVVDVGGVAVTVFGSAGVSHVTRSDDLHRPPGLAAISAAALDYRVRVGCVGR
ncbi:hypothetical protein PJL18_04115 [Paenarthrobacter nicotinovorans]|nr:hypothetical protein [Paenarthrobacter nicotinovorans]